MSVSFKALLSTESSKSSLTWYDNGVVKDTVSAVMGSGDLENTSGVQLLIFDGAQDVSLTITAQFYTANSGLTLNQALLQAEDSADFYSINRLGIDLNGPRHLLQEGLIELGDSFLGIFQNRADINTNYINADFIVDASELEGQQALFVAAYGMPDGGVTHITTGAGADIIALSDNAVNLTSATGTVRIDGGENTNPLAENIFILTANIWHNPFYVPHIIGDAMQNIDRIVLANDEAFTTENVMDESYAGEHLIIDGRGLTPNVITHRGIFGTVECIIGLEVDGSANSANESLTLYGNRDSDILIGGASNDQIYGALGNDTLTGGAGDDWVDGGSGSDTLHGDNGNDTLDGDVGSDQIFGGNGRDILIGGQGADFLQGGNGIDQARYNTSLEAVHINLLDGTATGGEAHGDTLRNIESLVGSIHDDTLYGDTGNNALFGHRGDDTLAGNGGVNKLFGGAGSDSFVLSDGIAYIMDFADDIDQLDVSNYGFSTLASALENLDQVGDHARFSFDGDTLFVMNTDMDLITDDIVI